MQFDYLSIVDSDRVMVGSYIMDEDNKRFEWIKDALKWKGRSSNIIIIIIIIIIIFGIVVYEWSLQV